MKWTYPKFVYQLILVIIIWGRAVQIFLGKHFKVFLQNKMKFPRITHHRWNSMLQEVESLDSGVERVVDKIYDGRMVLFGWTLNSHTKIYSSGLDDSCPCLTAFWDIKTFFKIKMHPDSLTLATWLNQFWKYHFEP